MVSAYLADALTNPTQVLDDLFNPNGDLDDFPQTVTTHFSTIFSDADAFEEIPQLCITSPPESHPDRALVRFRAMIQDTSPSPEIYLAKRNNFHCGGWGLGLEDGTANIDYADLRECTVLWAVTVPGESAWCTRALDSTNSTTSDNYVAHRPSHPHKFPIPGVPHVGAQIKLYDRADSYKSAELWTFVGILTSEPESYNMTSSQSLHLVPTIHVLFSQLVPPLIVPRSYPFISPSPSALREELITWIAQSSLAGDCHAAEYIFLSAISRVQSRTPPILPLTVTLSHFPSPRTETTPTICRVLSQIFPMSTVLPLTLETLNSTGFAPESKNEDLHSGRLQLPTGSVCVITENGITEGTVTECGLTNLRAIQEVMNTQTLEYIFPYSRFSFDTDIAFIVLSGGRKSAFFQTDVNIMLNPLGPAAEFDFYKNANDIALPSEEKLKMFRLLAGAAKVGTVSISEQMAEYIRENFVEERKTAISPSDALSSDDLIRRMMLARLLALSMQETEITAPIWEKAKALEMANKNKAVP